MRRVPDCVPDDFGHLFAGPPHRRRIGERTYRELSSTKIASQNRSDHGGRRQARNHFAAEIARFSASPAAKKSLAASDFGMQPQLAFKIARKSPVLKGRDFLHPLLPPSYRSQTSSWSQLSMFSGSLSLFQRPILPCYCEMNLCRKNLLEGWIPICLGFPCLNSRFFGFCAQSPYSSKEVCTSASRFAKKGTTPKPIYDLKFQKGPC